MPGPRESSKVLGRSKPLEVPELLELLNLRMHDLYGVHAKDEKVLRTEKLSSLRMIRTRGKYISLGKDVEVTSVPPELRLKPTIPILIRDIEHRCFMEDGSRKLQCELVEGETGTLRFWAVAVWKVPGWLLVEVPFVLRGSEVVISGKVNLHFDPDDPSTMLQKCHLTHRWLYRHLSHTLWEIKEALQKRTTKLEEALSEMAKEDESIAQIPRAVEETECIICRRTASDCSSCNEAMIRHLGWDSEQEDVYEVDWGRYLDLAFAGVDTDHLNQALLDLGIFTTFNLNEEIFRIQLGTERFFPGSFKHLNTYLASGEQALLFADALRTRAEDTVVIVPHLQRI